MLIKLSPVGNDPARLSVEVQNGGKSIVVGGDTFDFSPMGAGDTLPVAAISSTWFAGDVECDSTGELVVTLRFPQGPYAPHESRFPLPISVTVDGPVSLPLADGFPGMIDDAQTPADDEVAPQ